MPRTKKKVVREGSRVPCVVPNIARTCLILRQNTLILVLLVLMFCFSHRKETAVAVLI